MSQSMNSTKFKNSTKEQINRILDLNPGIQTQNSRQEVVYILNGMTNDGQNMNNQYFELTKVRSRRRLDSSGSDSSSHGVSQQKPLFADKEIIYVDLKDDDSLSKLALHFNCSIEAFALSPSVDPGLLVSSFFPCTDRPWNHLPAECFQEKRVAELKLANKIYTEQDLFALKAIKIPVVRDGKLYAEYLNKQKPKPTVDSSINTTKTISEFNSKSRNFRVESEYSLNPQLSYMSESDEDDIILDISRTDESSELLKEQRIRNVRLGQPINELNSNFQDFIENMDRKITAEIKQFEIQKETLEDTIDTLKTKVIFPPGEKEKPDKYGTVATLTWKNILLVLCLVAVLLPTGCLIYYYIMKKV